MFRGTVALIFTTFFLVGCADLKLRASPSCSYFSDSEVCTDTNQKRQIAIFFDGTGNTETSHTNIAKLHNLIALQDNPNIHTLYIPGVGTDTFKVVTGNLFGRGLDERVKLAYYYIASTYRQDRNDQIYIFGFSRGSYSARVLAGLIYVADIPDLQAVKSKSAQMKLIDKIYDKYKAKTEIDEKRAAIERINGYVPNSRNTRIAYMGIFDTVSALTYNPSGEKDIEFLSDEYEDQICNIDKISHAMSIDDNRAHSFTPVPMKVTQIASKCEGVNSNDEIAQMIDRVIKEVWFSGAHSDVGGGYDDSDISGVTLNWMMRQMKADKNIGSILPVDPYVPEDIYGNSHIGEDSILSGSIYINRNRNLPSYMLDHHPGFQTLVIHSSVIKRKEKVPRTLREFHFNPPKDFRNRNYDRCFKSVPVTDKSIPDKNRKENVTLKYFSDDNNPCFIIDES